MTRLSRCFCYILTGLLYCAGTYAKSDAVSEANSPSATVKYPKTTALPQRDAVISTTTDEQSVSPGAPTAAPRAKTRAAIEQRVDRLRQSTTPTPDKAAAPTTLPAAPILEPYAILKRADEARGNLQGISWQIVVESHEGRRTDTAVYDIKARGFDISGISLEPPKAKGNKLLMSNNNMWFYKPGLSKPIPIAQRQKLLGHAAYGDIASTNYADDYDAIPLPDELVGDDVCYVFDLKSKNEKTTYDRVKYWVAKSRLVGVKAEYFTVSGKKFKSSEMEYANTIEVDGQPRPFISKITMHDALLSNDVTYLSFVTPRFETLPDYVFNLNLFLK